MKQYDLIVVGAGASGLCAAIEAKKEARRRKKKLSILLIDKEKYPAKKILVTGNGKCNFANRNDSLSFYYGDKALIQAVFSRYPISQVPSFFLSIGVPAMDDGSGRLYPLSRKASGVADALITEAKVLGVDCVTEYTARDLRKTAEGYSVNDEYCSRALILATGSRAGEGFSDCRTFSFLQELNIACQPEIPALCGFALGSDYPRGLKGLRQICEIRLMGGGRQLHREIGEVQFNEKGVSGIPVMQASLVAGPVLQKKQELFLSLDFLPEIPLTDLVAALEKQARRCSTMPCERLFTAFLPKPLWLYALKASGWSAAKPLPMEHSALQKLAKHMKFARWAVTGLTSPAQVMRGGADARALYHNLQVKNRENLYVCGEAVDVTGACGGYNLMWAFCSGRTAGGAAAAQLLDKQAGSSNNYAENQ